MTQPAKIALHLSLSPEALRNMQSLAEVYGFTGKRGQGGGSGVSRFLDWAFTSPVVLAFLGAHK